MTFSANIYPGHAMSLGSGGSHRAFVLLLAWLFLGPAATFVMRVSDPNVTVFEMATDDTIDTRLASRDRYFTDKSTASLNELLEPTRLMVGLFVVVFLLNGIVRKTFGYFDRTELLMGAFSVVLLLSVLAKSKVMGFSLRVASDAFIVPFLVYSIARRLITNEDRFRRFSRAIVYMGVYVILISLVERATQEWLFYKLKGPFPFPATLYYVMSVVFFIVLSQHIQAFVAPGQSYPVSRHVRCFVLYLAPVVVLLGWSRGNQLGFLVGISLFIFLGRHLINRSRKIALIGTLLLLLSMTGFGIGLVGETLEPRIGNLHTVYGRIATWTVAIEAGLKSPVFGIGLNSLREVLATNAAEFRGVPNFPRIHNSYLAILAEQGLVGLVLYLALIVSIITLGVRVARTSSQSQDRWRGIALLAIMTAYLVPGMFAATLHVHPPLTHFFVYGFCGAIAGRYVRVRTPREFPYSARISQVTVIGGVR